MLLARFFKHLGTAEKPSPVSPVASDDRPCLLNVGGGSKDIPIPSHYAGWNHLLLDVDPRGNPDVLCDARELNSIEANQFDAIYCAHNLEHYYKHDGAEVLKGFIHVLKPDGFAEIRVPDLNAVMRAFVEKDMDIEDTLYVSLAGPITVQDVIYGRGVEIESSGDDFYAHKTGYTPSFLGACLKNAGFQVIFIFPFKEALEVRALAFKAEPTDQQRALLKLPTTAPR